MHTLLINLEKTKLVIGILVALAGAGVGFYGGVSARAAESQRNEDRLCEVEEDVQSIGEWIKGHDTFSVVAHRDLLQRLSRIEAKLEMLVEGK